MSLHKNPDEIFFSKAFFLIHSAESDIQQRFSTKEEKSFASQQIVLPLLAGKPISYLIEPQKCNKRLSEDKL